MTAALHGVRVLDLTRIFAGPWAAQLLADLGADVVKVEQPNGGDDVRRMGFARRVDDGEEPGQTSSFMAMNRNKRSIALDMGDPDDLATLHALVGEADVVIENFRAGGLRKFGLDHPTLAAAHPRLVYCSITGFGQDGPYAARPGYDPIFQAMSGLMSITGQPEHGGEALVGYSVSDLNAGLYATIAILAALRARDAVTGRGQHIDIALLDTQIAAQSHIAMNHLVSGQLPVRAGTASQINAPWQALATADRPIVVAVGNDRQFASFCQILGRASLARDVRFLRNRDRMANRPALIAAIEEALATADADTWVERLNSGGIACGPVLDFAGVADDVQVRHRALYRSIPDPAGGRFDFVANPIRLSDTPVAYERVPPRLDEHRAAVLTDWLGEPRDGGRA